jgi:thiol:disulfide interchange protein DsbD
MAVYFVSPLLPDSITVLLAPAFATVAVVYLGFLDSAGREFRAFLFARRIAGVVGLALIGAAYLPAGETEASLPFVPFSEQAHEHAKQRGAPFVIEFRADWCLPCKEMEERTFTDPSVVATGKGMSFLSVDMTTTDARVEAILENFEVIGAPTTIFFGSNGDERTRRVGFIGPEDFAELLRSSRDPLPGERAPQGNPGA